MTRTAPILSLLLIGCQLATAQTNRISADKRDNAMPHAFASSPAHLKPQTTITPPPVPSGTAFAVQSVVLPPSKPMVVEWYWQASTNWTRHVFYSSDMKSWVFTEGFQPSTGQQVFRFTNDHSGRLFYKRKDVYMRHVDLK